MADNPKLERLAQLDLTLGLTEQNLAEVADLVLRRHQRSSRQRGAILSEHQLRSYLERSETEQLGMRTAVQHVIDSLILLDLIERPAS